MEFSWFRSLLLSPPSARVDRRRPPREWLPWGAFGLAHRETTGAQPPASSSSGGTGTSRTYPATS